MFLKEKQRKRGKRLVYS